MEKEKEKMQKTISDLARRLERELGVKDSELKAFREEKSMQDEELQKVSEQLKVSQHHQNELQAGLGPLKEENTALKTELEEIKKFMKRELDEKQQTVETTKLDCQREINGMKEFVENERKSLQKSIEEKDNEIRKLQNEIKLKDENMHEKITASNQKIIDLEKKNSGERDLWRKLKDEYQDKLTSLEKTKKEVTDYMLNGLEDMLTKERLLWREKLQKNNK